MLVDNKFIYVNLPRCGSTSFHYSCILQDLEIKNLNSEWGKINSKINFKNIDEKNIMNLITHGHEELSQLREKFGFQYPVIAVKRDRYDTFYSLYKHIIFDFKRANAHKAYNFFKNISLDELFFFKTEDLYSNENRLNMINDFLLKNDLIKNRARPSKLMDLYSEEYIVNVINILITPSSYWHNHDNNIIWFDIKELNLMEKWVSNKIGKEFKLKQVNSSQHIGCSLKLDENFKKRYNSIYDFYDIQKTNKTLI
jgi:hypothetical protein